MCGVEPKPIEELDGEEWEYMLKLRAHRESLPVTTEGIEAYARHEVFGTLRLHPLKIVPAHEMLATYKQWLTRQGDQGMARKSACMTIMQALFACTKTASRVAHAVFGVVLYKCSEGKSP